MNTIPLWSSPTWHLAVCHPTTGGFTWADSISAVVIEEMAVMGAVTATVATTDAIGVYGVTVSVDGGVFTPGNHYSVVVTSTVAEVTSKMVLATFTAGPPITYVAVVADGGNTASTFKINTSGAVTDAWKDCLVAFLTGGLQGQVKKASSFNASTDFITVATPFTAAPSAGDQALLVYF